MSIKALQEYTYYSKYARYNKEAKRRETWIEACDRVMNMHLRKYPNASEEITWAFDQVKAKRVLGSQRALQFGGTPIERKNARIYNCTVSYCDRIRFFQECFWLLLCGCGTGFSVQKHHIDKLPVFHQCRSYNQVLPKRTYVIPDTIEGWADSLGVLLATYFHHEEFKDWYGYAAEFDYSQIRAAGSSLSSGTGKAPGPEPLRRSLEIIRKLLSNCLQKGQEQLKPIDAYDIVCHASDAVLSGGVRRSATICIFSVDDEEMIRAKTGNWCVENPQRARSNNSALLLRGKISKEQFENLIKSVREFGEPGFYWSDSTEQLPNPCVEIGMWPVDITTMISGWQFCNLCEINGRKIKSKADFSIAAKAGAIVGTLQAGYANFEYLGPVTERIVRREALLGVSITGMMDNPSIIFDPKIQQEMAHLVVKINEEMAAKLGINAAARCTCVKPAGTTSCILGSSSGIHPHHSKRYFRRTQGNAMEAPLQHFEKINPLAVEQSVWSANKTDKVITFCCEVPDGAKTKVDTPALELLGLVKLTQQNWVTYGKVEERCTAPWLTHNVSNTINIRPEEWDDVAKYIFDNQQWFAGISLLPQSGDLDYPQAPFTNISTPREILQRYGDGSLMASGLIVDGLHAFNGDLWNACKEALDASTRWKNLTKGKHWSEENELWEIENPGVFTNSDVVMVTAEYEAWIERYEEIDAKNDWIRRVFQFSERYCENDVRRSAYLMKEVNNWKLWLDLKREYKEVDYSTLFEATDETKPQETIACGGGACEVHF